MSNTISKKDFDANFKTLLDFMLDYGGGGFLPNQEDENSSGEKAYLAAVRLAGDDVEPDPILSYAQVYTGMEQVIGGLKNENYKPRT